MKDSVPKSNVTPRREIIALFGNARLVRWPDGSFQIQGGTAADRKNAAEWAATFMAVRFANNEFIRR